jgi:hypothetical protein
VRLVSSRPIEIPVQNFDTIRALETILAQSRRSLVRKQRRHSHMVGTRTRSAPGGPRAAAAPAAKRPRADPACAQQLLLEEAQRNLEFKAVQYRTLEVEHAALKGLHLRTKELLVAEREAARSPAITEALVRRVAKLVGEEAKALAQRERLDKERNDLCGMGARSHLDCRGLLPAAARSSPLRFFSGSACVSPGRLWARAAASSARSVRLRRRVAAASPSHPMSGSWPRGWPPPRQAAPILRSVRSAAPASPSS